MRVLVLIFIGFLTVTAHGAMFSKAPLNVPEMKKAGLTSKRYTTREKATVKWLTKAFQINDKSIAKEMYESIQEIDGNCPCPYMRAANGIVCGGRSTYSKAYGTGVLCFPTDVLDNREYEKKKLSRVN